LLLALRNLPQRPGGDPVVAVVPFGFFLSAIAVFILLVTGWLGGELVFRHRIGVMRDKGESGRSICVCAESSDKGPSFCVLEPTHAV